jgi:hypothetical protein
LIQGKRKNWRSMCFLKRKKIRDKKDKGYKIMELEK